MGTPSPHRGHHIRYEHSSSRDVVFHKRLRTVEPEYAEDARLPIAWMLGNKTKKATPTIERILFLHMEREARASVWLICIWYRLILFDGREICGWCSVEEAQAIAKRRPSAVVFLSRIKTVRPAENERAARPNSAHLKNLKQYKAEAEPAQPAVHGPVNKRPEVLH